MQIAVHGGRRAEGEVVLQGSKNAALPMLAASILTSDEMIFRHCPDISDVRVMAELLENLGLQTAWEDSVFRVQADVLKHSAILQKEAGRVRASILFLGSLLARTGEAKVHMPGGCSIGRRPIDIHIKALEQSGVKVEDKGEWLVCRRERVPKTVKIRFSYPSVGATENLLLFHASGNSDVVLENTAREPEICSLCEMLRDMGAKINGETTGTIHICDDSGRPHCLYDLCCDGSWDTGENSYSDRKRVISSGTKRTGKIRMFFCTGRGGSSCRRKSGHSSDSLSEDSTVSGISDRCAVTFPDTAFAGAWREYFVRDGI